MYYKTIPGKAVPWLAMAKETPFVTEPPDPIKEPGELWFDSGNTEKEALSNLQDEMIALGKEEAVYCDPRGME